MGPCIGPMGGANVAIKSTCIKSKKIFSSTSTAGVYNESMAMMCYDVHEPLYLNCEIYYPWITGSGFWVEQIWSQSENV